MQTQMHARIYRQSRKVLRTKCLRAIVFNATLGISAITDRHDEQVNALKCQGEQEDLKCCMKHQSLAQNI